MNGFNTKVAADVVTLASQGNVAAFKQLYQAYGNAVLRLVSGMLGSVEDARDLTQEIFIRVFNRLAELKQAEAFSGWLKQLSVRMAIDQLRQRKHLVISDIQQISDEEPDWDQMSEVLDKYEYTTYLMRGLTEAERAIVWLYVVEGYQHAELANMMGCSETAVRQRYRRAMVKIKMTLSELTQYEQ